MDQPKCSKCGGDRVMMQNGRGAYYIGCPTCKPGDKKVAKGAPPPAPAPKPKPGDTPPAPKPDEKKTHWLDDYL
jgi:hypothetical protein